MDSLTDYDIWVFGSREPDRYSIAASVVILYYDYLLTINSEYNLFWLDFRLSWLSFFYFLNRYTALAAQIPVIVEFFWDVSEQTCHGLQVFHQAYCVFALVLVMILLIFRTYALYDRNKPLLISLIFILIAGLAISCWQISMLPGLPSYPNGKLKICDLPMTKEQGRHYALAWSPAMVFDCIIFGLTLYKRLQIGRTMQNSLFTLMLRDGTMYFGFLGVAYVFELLNFLLWGDAVQMASLTNAIASTLISRLMLNIRDPKNSDIHGSTVNPISSIAFNHPDELSTEDDDYY